MCRYSVSIFQKLSARCMLQEFAAEADTLSGFVLGDLARAPDMVAGKASAGLARHALLDVHISATLNLKLAALKVRLHLSARPCRYFQCRAVA